MLDDMPLLRTICDEVIALELEHPAVIVSYLGGDDTAMNRSGAVASA